MNKKPNYLRRYIIGTYVLIWTLIIFVGVPTFMILPKFIPMPPVILWIIRNFCAWSPTLLLLIGWKHFRPDETRMGLVKRCFSEKVNPLFLLFSFGLTFGISLLSLFILSIVEGNPIRSYISVGTTPLLLSILLSFTSGPTGEELGWRGFMREEFNKRYPFLKSSICQGLVWCFWHALLWVVDSDFTDWRAIPYIIAQIVVTTSITVIMNVFLERHNNLIYSVMLHFGFNLIYVFSDAGILFAVILTILYLIITPITVWIRNQSVKTQQT